MCCHVLRDYITSSPQFSGSCGTESKNILKSVKLSSKSFQIKLLRCANFGAVGSIGRISESILWDFEPGPILFGSDYNNVYIE